MWLKDRSYQKELIDGELSFDELKVNLNELHTINKYLGGYKISMSAFDKLEASIKGVVDLGCGGGHFLLQFRKRLPSSLVVGIDLKQECIDYAAQTTKGKDIQLKRADFRSALEMDRLEVLHACLFFHHFHEDEIIRFLENVKQKEKILIINDLERNPLAYMGIRILTLLFSRSRLVKNDAPLSVKRGFKRKEWIKMIQKAGIENYSIKNKWAFRHQIVINGKI